MCESIISKKTFADLVSVFFYPKESCCITIEKKMLGEQIKADMVHYK